MRRLSVLTAALAAAAAVVLARRRSAQRRERVDLYYDDGSMVSLEGRTAESERLLDLARQTLAVARS
jgi:hypothetical protein